MSLNASFAFSASTPEAAPLSEGQASSVLPFNTPHPGATEANEHDSDAFSAVLVEAIHNTRQDQFDNTDGTATRKPLTLVGRQCNAQESETENTALLPEDEKGKGRDFALESAALDSATIDALVDDFMTALDQAVDTILGTNNENGGSGTQTYTQAQCAKDGQMGIHPRSGSPFGAPFGKGASSADGRKEALMARLQDILERMRNGSGANPNGPTAATPTLSTGASPLINTTRGGTGQAQRDIDPEKAGTQINIVLDDGMSEQNRDQSIEALQRWADISKGELEFHVYEDGQQPSGQDFILMQSVPPDNTTTAGVADVGRSPDGVTELQFESDSGLAVVMHEIGHTLGLEHSDGVLRPVNAVEEFSPTNIADLAALYPNINNA